MGVMADLLAAFAPPEHGEGMLTRIDGMDHLNIILKIQKQWAHV